LAARASPLTYPRYFSILGRPVNSYKVFLCVGLYAGIVVSAAVAERRGVSPLRMGIAALVCALAGLAGARLYYLAVGNRKRERASATANTDSGGAGVFGGLFAVAPLSFAVAALFHIRAALFWDALAAGILLGGFWIRCGCVFNGCCAGRETHRFGLWLHDTDGVRKRRLPVQVIEMGWWLLGGVAYVWLWHPPLPPGSYAWGVLGWYGFGRFWLEPLREAPTMVAGRLRINQVVAAILALAGGCLFVLSL
jgi:prolipoprotein diacylglyceryltransferase